MSFFLPFRHTRKDAANQRQQLIKTCDPAPLSLTDLALQGGDLGCLDSSDGCLPASPLSESDGRWSEETAGAEEGCHVPSATHPGLLSARETHTARRAGDCLLVPPTRCFGQTVLFPEVSSSRDGQHGVRMDDEQLALIAQLRERDDEQSALIAQLQERAGEQAVLIAHLREREREQVVLIAQLREREGEQAAILDQLQGALKGREEDVEARERERQAMLRAIACKVCKCVWGGEYVNG
jgi:hypothetical protein